MADPKIIGDAQSTAAKASNSDLLSLEPGLVENALTQALPLPDIMFGGAVLLLVIMTHALWIRIITGSFLKRLDLFRVRASLWRADVLFALVVMALLALHLTEIVIWSAALIFGSIVDGWGKAAYFAANCYTALGEPFALPHAWRIVPPIIAISGIFTFAWTASVLVDFVSRYNAIRDGILARRNAHADAHHRLP